MLSAWSKILTQVPNSHLLIKSVSLNDPEVRIIAKRLETAGIAGEPGRNSRIPLPPRSITSPPTIEWMSH
jgi:predicted O-linked N-acetylglucosamine transferase (SPINDLY family)